MRAACLQLLLVALCVVARSAAGRGLNGCHTDNCGMWCGPPRAAPCGTGYSAGGGGPGYWGSQPSYGSGSQPSYNNRPSYNNGPSSYGAKPPSGGGNSKPNPPPSSGCVDSSSLPFGLENCICDGAQVGQAAGLAACGRVSTECFPVAAPFSASGMLESVQQICDTFALDACISSAQSAPVMNQGCGQILRSGTPFCSPQQAMDIFMRSVNKSCDPICKDCARRG